MKKNLNLKKYLKIIPFLIIIFIIYMIPITIINNKNNKYLDSITEEIKKNYELNGKITSFNMYGNYYILTTKKNVIVLNLEYEEILKDKLRNLSSNPKDYKLIYKNNKLMYEETILKKSKLTYKYYDAKTYEFIKEIKMEKK